MGGKYYQGNSAGFQAIAASYGPIHMMVEAAGFAPLDFDLIEKLGNDGIYAMTGVPGGDRPLNVDAPAIMRQIVLKNQLIFGSVNAGKEHFRQAVLDLEAAQNKWPNLIEQFITARIPYQKFDTVLGKKSPDEIKAVLVWHL
jgi:threonine dehydrogenase-like Zn-dependent dehydrogenase